MLAHAVHVRDIGLCFTSAHYLKVFYMVRYSLYYGVTKQSYVMLIVQCLEYHGGCLYSYFFSCILKCLRYHLFFSITHY